MTFLWPFNLEIGALESLRTSCFWWDLVSLHGLYFVCFTLLMLINSVLHLIQLQLHGFIVYLSRVSCVNDNR